MDPLFATTLLQHLVQIDTDITLAINGLHCPFWDEFMTLFSNRWVWIPFYASLVALIASNFSWRITLTVLILSGVVVAIADQVTVYHLRPLMERMRPSNPDNPVSAMVHVVNNHRGGPFGFPSAHAANAWAIAFFLIFVFRQRRLTWLLLPWTAMMCYSRMYLGVHYLGDLLAGLVVGLAAATLCFLPFQRVSHLKRPATYRLSWVPAAVMLLTIVIFLVVAAVKSI